MVFVEAARPLDTQSRATWPICSGAAGLIGLGIRDATRSRILLHDGQMDGAFISRLRELELRGTLPSGLLAAAAPELQKFIDLDLDPRRSSLSTAWAKCRVSGLLAGELSAIVARCTACFHRIDGTIVGYAPTEVCPRRSFRSVSPLCSVILCRVNLCSAEYNRCFLALLFKLIEMAICLRIENL